MYEFSIGEGETKINYKIEEIGDDLDITISGGKEHVGCIALITKNSYNLFTLPGHREDDLIFPLIKPIQEKTKGTVVIKAGFHIDGITLDEIKEVLSNNKKALKKIEEILGGL